MIHIERVIILDKYCTGTDNVITIPNGSQSKLYFEKEQIMRYPGNIYKKFISTAADPTIHKCTTDDTTSKINVTLSCE